jgi:hypothetical protein
LFPGKASRQILTCVSRRPPSISFMMQPINQSMLDFEG